MNTQKAKIRISLIISIPIITFLLVLWGKNQVEYLINTTVVQMLSILVGLTIGAVGILLSSLSNIFSTLLNYCSRDNDVLIEESKERIINWINKINLTVKEIKENLIFLVFALLGSFLILILTYINIPLINWPINDIFPKYSFLSWISLTLLGYSFLAILDIINTMFVINKHHEVFLKYELTFKNRQVK